MYIFAIAMFLEYIHLCNMRDLLTGLEDLLFIVGEVSMATD